MATPNSDWGEILTTTMENRSGELADSIEDNVALMHLLKEGGAFRPVSGGESIIEEVIHSENSTYKRYSGGEPLDIGPSESFSAFAFGWKQVAVAVTATGLEIDVQNAGPEQVMDLLAERVNVAETTFVNNLTADCYSAGTADGSKQVGGLQHLVPDDPTTGTVGGISRVTYTFARSQYYRGVTDGGAAVSATNIQDYMLALWLRCTLNKEHPTGILADNNYWSLYFQSLTPLQRITNNKVADAGYKNLEYMGVPVILDGGIGGNCPSNHMYFLNTKKGNISYRPHKKRNIVPLKPDRYATNADSMVRLLAWAGNMTVRVPRLQGCLIA